MISGGVEVNQFALISFIVEVKFGDNPLTLKVEICFQTLTVVGFLTKLK